MFKKVKKNQKIYPHMFDIAIDRNKNNDDIHNHEYYLLNRKMDAIIFLVYWKNLKKYNCFYFLFFIFQFIIIKISGLIILK